jgi:hypothetical protein
LSKTFKLKCVSHNVPENDTLLVASIENGNVIATHCYADSVIRLQFKGGKIIGCLIDTGAAISCVSTTALSTIMPQYESKMNNITGRTFRSASGAEMTPIGTVNLQFYIGSTECETECYVFPKLSQEMILGRSFLNKYQATVDFGLNTFSFQIKATLYPTQSVTLKPRELCVIQAECRDKNIILPTGLHGIVPQMKLKSGIIFHASAVTSSDNTVPIMVENKSNKSVTVHNTQCIGHFTPLSETQCMTIDEKHEAIDKIIHMMAQVKRG